MPTDSKRLQVINRIVDVLKSIRESDDYWATPLDVRKASTATFQGYPAYIVGPETGGEMIMELNGQNEEIFYLAIEGWIQEAGDIVTPLEHAIQDVQGAITADFRAGGGLIALASNVWFDAPPEVEYFEGETGVFARFKQRLKIQIYGEFGEL